MSLRARLKRLTNHLRRAAPAEPDDEPEVLAAAYAALGGADDPCIAALLAALLEAAAPQLADLPPDAPQWQIRQRLLVSARCRELACLLAETRAGLWDGHGPPLPPSAGRPGEAPPGAERQLPATNLDTSVNTSI
jgi:hypothetical protein